MCNCIPDEVRAILRDIVHAAIDTTVPLLARWYLAPDELPLSSVLCTAVLGEPIRATDYAAAQGMHSNRVDHTKWGWPLTDIERLEPFVPARGMQGFWTWRHGDG